MRIVVLLAGTATAVLAVAGCVSHKAPKLKIVEARVADETNRGVVISFGLDATNENTEALPLREVRYTLRLADREVFRGVRGGEATLRRFGTQRIQLPAAWATTPDSPRPTGVVEYELAGSLSYIAPGHLAQILFDTGVSRPTVRFRQAGTIDMGGHTP